MLKFAIATIVVIVSLVPTVEAGHRRRAMSYSHSSVKSSGCPNGSCGVQSTVKSTVTVASPKPVVEQPTNVQNGSVFSSPGTVNCPNGQCPLRSKSVAKSVVR